MPVFPDVASMIVIFRPEPPLQRAFDDMYGYRSLMLPPGFKNWP